jgi:hypothetical protein
VRTGRRGALLFPVIVLALAASASADTLDVLYRNTLTLTDAQGGVTTVRLAEDGKFQQTNARGMWAAGFWTLRDGRFCMTPRGESEICFPLESDKPVGAKWEINGPSGKPVWTARIEEGRAEPDKEGAAADPSQTPGNSP